MNVYETQGQAWARIVFLWAMLVLSVVVGFLEIRAQVVCWPRYGSWFVTTGTICYGENP